MGKKNNSNTEVEKLGKNMEFENLDVAFSVDYFGADYRSPIYFPGNEKTAPAITSSYSPFQTIMQANDAAYHARMCMQSSTPENIANFYNTILTDVIEDKICYELGANINIILYNGICNLIRMYIIKDGFINEMLYDLTHAHRYIYDAVSRVYVDNRNNFKNDLDFNSYRKYESKNNMFTCYDFAINDMRYVQNRNEATDNVIKFKVALVTEIGRFLAMQSDKIIQNIDVIKFATDLCRAHDIDPNTLAPSEMVAFATSCIGEQLQRDTEKISEIVEILLMNSMSLFMMNKVDPKETVDVPAIENKINNVKMIPITSHQQIVELADKINNEGINGNTGFSFETKEDFEAFMNALNAGRGQ